ELFISRMSLRCFKRNMKLNPYYPQFLRDLLIETGDRLSQFFELTTNETFHQPDTITWSDEAF
ncbi:hypothetical protein SK128_021506, partial [Halocaridina rubra]